MWRPENYCPRARLIYIYIYKFLVIESKWILIFANNYINSRRSPEAIFFSNYQRRARASLIDRFFFFVVARV